MEPKGKLPDVMKGGAGALKHLLSRVLGLGEVIAAYDEYKQNNFKIGYILNRTARKEAR